MDSEYSEDLSSDVPRPCVWWGVRGVAGLGEIVVVIMMVLVVVVKRRKWEG